MQASVVIVFMSSQASPGSIVPLPQTALATQAVPIQLWLLLHRFGQLPPQPSGPHDFPAHCGVQVQVPALLQVCVLVQLPQLPLQPSGPQFFPPHCCWHAHVPALLQVCGLVQLPQLLPQPSGPQFLPPHCCWHVHFEFWQA
jgi:hypothetical protein